MSNCKYYKCHDIPDELYDCSLCYCPFYDICSKSKEHELFGGYMLNNNILACEKCTYFHLKENVTVYKELKSKNMDINEIYGYFIQKIKQENNE